MLEYTQMLENANKKLEKSVQFLNDSAIKLQAETDALKKALLTCSVKRQELQAENKALRETILGELTTADDFNSEFRHNPDDDAPGKIYDYRLAKGCLNDDDTTAYDTTKCDGCQKEILFDDTNFVQNSDGTVRYECNVCYNLDS